MKILLIVIITLYLSACATSVNVDYPTGVNFSKLKTFRIQAKPVKTTANTRIDSPFMQQRTVEALKTEFTSKGFYFNKDKADMVIKYHLVIKQEFETDDSGVFLGFGTSTSHSAIGLGYSFPDREVASVDNLVLTIDIFDPQNVLLWRGSLGQRLTSGSTPESNNRLMQGLVTEILKQFPPK